MKRPRLLAVSVACLLLAGFSAPAWSGPAAPEATIAGAAQEQEQEQKKKKRGKVVKATVVPSEPATEEAEEAAEAKPEKTDAKAEKRAAREAEKEAARAERERQKTVEREAAAERAAASAATPRAAATERPAPTPVADVEPPRAQPPVPPRQDTFVERIQVREVLLDVQVTDRRGNPVVGLGPEDFVVLEGRERREVTGVTYYGGVSELSGSGVEGETRTDRYFILFFHDQKQAAPFLTAAQLEAGRWTKRWIEEQLLPNDQVAVMGYDVRLKLYQDFTRDRQALIKAVDDAALGKKEPDRWTTRSGPELDPDSPSLAVNLPTGRTLSRQTRKLQQALQLVGEAAEGVVGRKNLLLFSVGFGEIDDFGLYTPDPRYYPPMKEALNNGNVAVYGIDTVGSRRGNPAARDINDSLSAIATDTGGHYYSMFTNVLTPLRQVAEDNVGYYLLSYRAEYETGTSGYREVKVETRDKSFDVRARKGYKYGSSS